MAKWADYCISAVSFNAAHTHIERLRVHRDNGDSIESPSISTRAEVVRAIENGTTFTTIMLNAADNKWLKGQRVYVIAVNGSKYLKTVDNRKPEDNLDNLPEF